MSKSTQMLDLLVSAGQAGVPASELDKVLGNRQAVHSCAWAIKKQGIKLLNHSGVYVIRGQKKPGVEKPSVSIPTNQLETARAMDLSDKAQFIEQMRLEFFHQEVARVILKSYDYAHVIKEAIQ